MGEGIEAKLAMVSSHAARTNTSEGQLFHPEIIWGGGWGWLVREVHDGVVDKESSTTGLGLEEVVNLGTGRRERRRKRRERRRRRRGLPSPTLTSLLSENT